MSNRDSSFPVRALGFSPARRLASTMFHAGILSTLPCPLYGFEAAVRVAEAIRYGKL